MTKRESNFNERIRDFILDEYKNTGTRITKINLNWIIHVSEFGNAPQLDSIKVTTRIQL